MLETVWVAVVIYTNPPTRLIELFTAAVGLLVMVVRLIDESRRSASRPRSGRTVRHGPTSNRRRR